MDFLPLICQVCLNLSSFVFNLSIGVQLGDVYISIYDGCYLCISGLSLALKKEVCD